MPRPRQVLDSAPMLYAATVAVLLAVQAARQFADPDLWGRISAAALWVENGHFPYLDTLSFTARLKPWVDHEWLSGLAFYGVLRAFGEAGFLLFKDLMLGLTVALVFRLHARVHRVPPAYAFCGFLATLPFLSLGYRSTLRCQVFSFLLFLAFVAILEAIRTGRARPRMLASLVPMGVLWANLHAGFIMGIFALAAYGAGAALKASSLRGLAPSAVTALSILLGAATLNPYGPRYLVFLVHAWVMDRSDIIEWAPLWVAAPAHIGAWLLVITAAGLLCWRLQGADRRTVAGPLALLFVLLAMAWRAYRFQTFLALGLVALLPVLLPPHRLANLPLEYGRSLLRTLVAGSFVFGFASLASPESHPFRAPLLTEIYPLEAVRYLRAVNASGNIATPLTAGEFVAWALYPRMRVALDGRFEEVYDRETARRWLNFYRSQGEFAFTDAASWARSQGAGWVLTTAGSPGTDRALQQSGIWAVAHRNAEFTLWQAGANPAAKAITAEEATIADYFRPEDLARFYHRSP